ncbi:MAG: BREX system P-loop protein BrxC [Gordonibacter sp.]|uniref:BREX system P-loop protein BrxC n=1 Tax=Gordonibacter sp. TaxID=1968902 RepID=UPI002FC867C9
MIVHEMFAKDITRTINGVVNVGQNDEAFVQQELSEYVVTRELQKHFATFFESYDNAIDYPSNRIGVWISGFFGSGKSHFLKMLSYLLENREIAGTPAVDYFDGKIADPMVYSRMKRATSIPTETILFNIDAKASQWKEGDKARTAVLRAFASTFYEHQGCFAGKFGVARFELLIDEAGKTDAFRAAYERIQGKPWVDDRKKFRMRRDPIIAALVDVMDLSPEAAMSFYEEGSNDEPPSIEELASQVATYTSVRAQQYGGQFRLLFMVDEVGQFIGADVSLMLNLQTIVEELGAKCAGRAWVMVTSQEAIDEVVMVVGNDFSKIQGRFNTRLSLSSSSVDEVIKRRILDKTQAAEALLKDEYAKQSAVLKNLFVFDGSRGDLGGYASERDFTESYPFVGYQFKVLPDVMEEIRKHGLGARHMSTGERSMLSAFQESTLCVSDCSNTALVPFWRFFDTIAKDLDHGVVQVIERCQRAAESSQGLHSEDVSVLKLLYLVRYIDYVKASLGNIAIMMIEDMSADKVVVRDHVKASLDRLVRENYVARNGDSYSFLTNEEQDIAREIASTSIDPAEVVDLVKRIVFEGIFTARKYRKGPNDFLFDRYVDDTVHGNTQGGMRLNIITLAHELSSAEPGELNLKSSGQALVVLSQEADYYRVIKNAVQIRKYVRTKNVSQLPEGTQRIIADKNKEAATNESEARGLLEEALKNAHCAVNGQMVQVRAASAKQKIEGALDALVASVYTKADYIDTPVEGESDVLQILLGNAQRGLAGIGGGNDRAAEEVERHLEVLSRAHQVASMGDIQRKYQQVPYGWREIDIAAVVARLVADQKVVVSVAGAPVEVGDRTMVECLREKGAERAQIKRRVALADSLLKRARDLLRDFSHENQAPADEDGLVKAVRAALESQLEKLKDLLSNQYTRSMYPGRTVVEEGIVLLSRVLGCAADSEALLREFTDAQDELLDLSEDLERVCAFFPNQQRLFDESLQLMKQMSEERAYIEGNAALQADLKQVQEIVSLEQPYQRIHELTHLNQKITAQHSELVRVKRADLLVRMDGVQDEIKSYALDVEGGDLGLSRGVLADAQKDLARRKSSAHEALTCGQLDMHIAQLEAWRGQQLAKIDNAIEAERTRKSEESTMREQHHQDVRVLKPLPGSPAAPDSGLAPKTPEPVAPKVKVLPRAEVCPAKRLSSTEEVDAYVGAIRTKLLTALQNNDSVRVD